MLDRANGLRACLFSSKLVNDWWLVGRLFYGRPSGSGGCLGRLCAAAKSRHLRFWNIYSSSSCKDIRLDSFVDRFHYAAGINCK